MGVVVRLCGRLGRFRHARYYVPACCRTTWHAYRSRRRSRYHVPCRNELPLPHYAVSWCRRCIRLREKRLRIRPWLSLRLVSHSDIHSDRMGECDGACPHWTALARRALQLRLPLPCRWLQRLCGRNTPVGCSACRDRCRACMRQAPCRASPDIFRHRPRRWNRGLRDCCVHASRRRRRLVFAVVRQR